MGYLNWGKRIVGVILYPETIEWLIEKEEEDGTPWREIARCIIYDAMEKDEKE